ncbi:MAG: NUDIX domain-containing protein [Candidatus Woesearchaeota archaeon]|nr:NUDIX domain-containing protein [Candidatus Woesearchaeota archaeon]
MTDKFEKEVLVVPRAKLFLEDEFTGFREMKGAEYLKRIKNSFEFIKRGLAETNPSYKQIIPYAVIANKKKGKAYLYTRGAGKGYSEKRLYSKGSMGVGGHIEHEDCNEGEKGFLEKAMLREISEEISIKGKMEYKLFGFINFENTEVSRVHFGVVYLVETDAEEVSFNNEEIASGKMISGEELEKAAGEMELEEWTEILIAPIKKYLAEKVQARKKEKGIKELSRK